MSVECVDDVELDPVDDRLLVDRARVGGPAAQRLAVGLTGTSDVDVADHREGHRFDRVDLDLPWVDPVAAALLDLGPAPQTHREGDLPRQNVVAQITAELHWANVTPHPNFVMKHERMSYAAPKTIKVEEPREGVYRSRTPDYIDGQVGPPRTLPGSFDGAFEYAVRRPWVRCRTGTSAGSAEVPFRVERVKDALPPRFPA